MARTSPLASETATVVMKAMERFLRICRKLSRIAGSAHDVCSPHDRFLRCFVRFRWSSLDRTLEEVLMYEHRPLMPLYFLGAVCIAIGAAIAPAGCGATSCADSADCTTTAGTGAGGDKGASGAAGSGGSGGSAGSAGAGGNPSDASGGACGGFANLPCPDPAKMFCDFPEQMACGQGDITGVCLPRPDTCSKDCP